MARKHTLLVSAALALSLAGVPAMAQQPQPGAQQEGVGSSLMKKAIETKFADSHLDVAGQVLKASGIGTIFANAVPNVVGSLRVNYTRMRPELAKDIEESLKLVEAEVTKVNDDGLKSAARFLAVRMSESELKEVLSFLNSASGKKYVESLPGVTDDIVPFVELWSQEITGRLTATFQAEMAKRGHKL